MMREFESPMQVMQDLRGQKRVAVTVRTAILHGRKHGCGPSLSAESQAILGSRDTRELSLDSFVALRFRPQGLNAR
jgi:hypothetical protein